MCTRTEDVKLENRSVMRKVRQTDSGRPLIIRGASSEQRKKVAEAYIWILQNFMPEFGEIKSGRK